ncbi:MAG: glycosyl transferase family 1, partial [Bacteroidetes bacterium]|nr:glycosyl transferase family 1 [Bacteroidota bacterium]
AVITNGYDHEDFKLEPSIDSDKFSLVHAGSMNKDRNPLALWRVLGKLCKENAEFANLLKIELIGAVDFTVVADLKENGIYEKVTLIDRMNHDEVIAEQCKSSVLILALNNTPNISGVVPGKIFEYLRAGRPILAIGSPSGDSARILSETNHGVTLDFNDQQGIEAEIKSLFERYKNRELNVDSKGIEKYNRKVLTENMVNEFNRLLE